jgi:hypothetical protein
MRQPEIGGASYADAPRRGGNGGFAGLVLGGMLAAAAGAGAMLYFGPERIGTQSPSAQEIALLGQVKSQGDSLNQLKVSVEQLSATAAKATEVPVPDLSALDTLSSRLDATDAAQADILARLDAAEARLAALEARPAADSGAPGATDANLAEVQKLLDTQRAEAEAAQARLSAAAADAEERIKAAEAEAARLKADSEAAAKLARGRAAVSHLQASLESGASIQPALDDLASLGIDVPPALSDQAGGVPSLDALKSAFPPAAREALALSLRETAGTGTFDRLLAFLRVESGARSLSPRAGEDPDAVLSRAEAALKAGDVPGSIAEIAALPPAGQARMAEWVALAQRRVSAVEALKTLIPADQGG